MDLLNLREAARRTRRSVTTLRRYVRSGRLRAEKRDGRYGPEYFVREDDLAAAGFHLDGAPPVRVETSAPLARRPDSVPATPEASAPSVPVSMYLELQWKHEQLLVQYGMMRAGGMRALELREQLATSTAEAERREGEIRDLRARRAEEVAALEKSLREVRFELEGRSLEVAALQEKVRALELLTRNRVTSEPIDDQYARLVRQLHRVERHASQTAPPGEAAKPRRRPWIVRDAPPRGDDH